MVDAFSFWHGMLGFFIVVVVVTNFFRSVIERTQQRAEDARDTLIKQAQDLHAVLLEYQKVLIAGGDTSDVHTRAQNLLRSMRGGSFQGASASQLQLVRDLQDPLEEWADSLMSKVPTRVPDVNQEISRLQKDW